MKKYIPLLLVLLAVLAFNFVVCRITIDEQNEKIAEQDSIIASYERLFDEIVK